MDDPDVEEQRYRALMGNGDEMLSMIWVQLHIEMLTTDGHTDIYVTVFLQTTTKASVPDSEKPEPDASAFIASPLPPQHPRLQPDIMLHLRSLQQGGHATLQLHIWQRERKWDHPGQQDRQYHGESRRWVRTDPRRNTHFRFLYFGDFRFDSLAAAFLQESTN